MQTCKHTGALIITSENDPSAPCTSQGHLFCDHHVVLFDLSLPKKEFKKKTITYGKLKNINYSTFAAEINKNMEGIKGCNGSLNQLIFNFNEILLDTLDEFAPKKTKVISNRQFIPWLHDNITNLIKERCKAENIWRKDKSNANNFIKFYRLCRLASNTMDIIQKAYCKDKPMECKNNYKQVFSVYNSLLGRAKDIPLPPCESKQQLSNEFNEYFIDKISKIRDILFASIDDLNSKGYDHATYTTDPPVNTLLTCYRELTIDEVVKLIMRALTKSCESDPIPTSLLKQLIHELGCMLLILSTSTLHLDAFILQWRVHWSNPCWRKPLWIW